MLSLAAAGLYLAVAFLGARAAVCAGAQMQPRHHRRLWALVAIAFVLFAVSRLIMLEDLLRDAMRAAAESRNLYSGRREVQLPLALLALAAISALLIGWLNGWRRFAGSRRERLLHLARLGILGMGMLIVLRLISFHGIDRWLYAGPRLNWWFDIGASLLVGLSAWRYLRLLNRPGIHS